MNVETGAGSREGAGLTTRPTYDTLGLHNVETSGNKAMIQFAFIPLQVLLVGKFAEANVVYLTMDNT